MVRPIQGWLSSWATTLRGRNQRSQKSAQRSRSGIQQIELLEVRSLLSASGIVAPAAIQASAISTDQYFYFSSSVGGTLRSSNGSTVGLTTDDIARLIVHANGSYEYSLFFRGSDVGLSGGSESIDAFTVLKNGSLLISTTGLVSVPGAVGTGTDLLKFVPKTLGTTTTGTWSAYFRGASVGLSTTTENIDGVAALPDGRLVLSTKGNFQVSGFTGNGADLMSFAPTQLGYATRGTWGAYLDSDDIGMAALNVDAVAIASNGAVLLSTTGKFSLSGVSGSKSDVVTFNPLSLGLNTIGSFESSLALSASRYGLTNFNINGLQVGRVASDRLANSTNTATTPIGTFQIQIDYENNNITASQRAIFERAVERWEQVILSQPATPIIDGVPSNTLIISASSTIIDGVGGVLGEAGPTVFRPTTKLPARGEMNFDSTDLASLEADGDLYTVILHEMGHVLGIGTIWSDQRLVPQVGNEYRFTGRNAVAQYDALFGVTTAYVPVEAGGGSGTAGSHWSDSVFGNELMTGYINAGVMNPLSRVTIGSLQDLGYTVNYAAADPYTPPTSSRTR